MGKWGGNVWKKLRWPYLINYNVYVFCSFGIWTRGAAPSSNPITGEFFDANVIVHEIMSCEMMLHSQLEIVIVYQI